MSDDIQLRVPQELAELLGLTKNELEIQNQLLLIFELYQLEKSPYLRLLHYQI